ncbi:MAG TPA: DNA gyrase inhibitor YacG [Alphaproteobacteria bacterium]|nr:DNA gyrase inhibitor YacG [Alphaproteobacteria bacterium]
MIDLDRTKRRRRRNCPICGRSSDSARAPFCSKRCADEDLRRWLSGAYRIESNQTPESGEPTGSDGDGAS